MEKNSQELLEELVARLAEVRGQLDVIQSKVDELLNLKAQDADEPGDIDIDHEDFLSDIAVEVTVPEQIAAEAEPAGEPEPAEPVETSVGPDLPEAAIEPDLPEPEPSESVVANEPEEPADAQDAAAPVSVNADEAGDVNSLFGAVEEWYTAIPGPEVKDIRSAISLNDRVMFITTLFRDDSMLFQDVVSKVNAMTSLDKVADYLTSTFPEWDMYSDMVYRFMMAVRRKLR